MLNENIEEGPIFRRPAEMQSLWAKVKSLEKRKEELRSTLENWLRLGLPLGHASPVIK